MDNKPINTDHIFDVDNNMRVPSRISMSGDRGYGMPSSYYMRDNLDLDNNGDYSMDIPQRILVGGGDSHVLVKHEAMRSSAGVIAEEAPTSQGTTRTNWSDKQIFVETPPISMTLNKVHYPDIEEAIDTNQRRNSFEDVDSLTSLYRRVENIQHKMDTMERREEARKKREWLIIGSVGLIMLMKFYSVLFGRNS